LPDMPAAKADLKAGDVVVQIDEISSPHLKQMQDYVDRNKEKEIYIQITRGEEVFDKKITPMVYKDTGKGGFGVSITEVGIIQYPWYRAIYEGVILTFLYLKAILVAFYFIIKGLFTGAGVSSAISGPIGIAVMTGQIAKLGVHYLLNFTAVLSLNLAILNILPNTSLDGGRLVFLLIGKAFKKNIAMKYEQMAHTIGFVLLMLLIVVITVKDVGRFTGGFKNIIDKIF
jgi:Predicted membrane-associated Zn-dependent proteases 1